MIVAFTLDPFLFASAKSPKESETNCFIPRDILSLRALEKQEEKSALKDNALKNKEIEDATKSNIGDLIKAEMEDTKSEDE